MIIQKLHEMKRQTMNFVLSDEEVDALLSLAINVLLTDTEKRIQSRADIKG